MSDIGKVLKEEIRRLAKSEARRETEQLRRTSAQHRKDIARLKRELDDAHRKLRILEGETKRVREVATSNGEDTEQRRFSAKGLRSHRQKLGLSAADYGKLVGVSGQTIYHWEQGKARPRGESFTKLVELRTLGKRAALARLATLE